MNKQHVTLSDDDRSTLERLLSHGTLSARTFKRATALLELDRGKTLQDVAATLQVTYPTVSSWRDKYTTLGLRSLDDAPRSGRPIEIDGEQLETEVLALLKERSAKAITIHWQFSIQAARSKLNSKYTRVNTANEKYRIT